MTAISPFRRLIRAAVLVCASIIGAASCYAQSQPAAESDSLKQWRISTDIPAWACLVTNITGEYDFRPHWSAAMTVRYSAFNYGTATRKFRTFELRPQLRYWIKDSHTGLFFDAHVAMIAYNVALSRWDYRIQDRSGKHPALGGGIGIGYRVPFKDPRFAMEFSIGAGIYHLDYNRFENRWNGTLIDRHTRTFYGIDRAGISLVYNFNAGGSR